MTTVLVALTPGTDTDQSVSAQAQIAAVPDGTVGSPNTVVMPDGFYRMDRGLGMSNKSHIRWTYASSGFIAYTDLSGIDTGQYTVNSDGTFSSFRKHFGITGCTDVIATGLRIEGPDATATTYGNYADSHAAEHAFGIYNANAINGGSVDCGYEDCSSTRVYGDVCYVGGQNVSGYHSNQNIHFTRIQGVLNGRQGAGIVDVDGLDMTDIDIRGSGRSGYDAEPNGKYNRTWNVNLVRVLMAPKFGGFAIQGSGGGVGAGIPVRNKNYYMEDCTSLSTQNGLTAYGDIAHQGAPGESGYFICKGYRNITQSGSTTGMTARCWQDITIDDAIVTTGAHTPISTAVIASCYGALTLTNSDFSGFTGQGYDRLLVVPTSLGDVPTSVVDYGNIWNAGQNDGGPPSGNNAVITQTLPMLTQTATATGGTTPVPTRASRFSGKFAAQPLGLFQFANPELQQEAVITQTLPMLTQSATATNGNAISGGIDQTLPMLTQSATAQAEFGAVITQDLPMLDQVATAVVSGFLVIGEAEIRGSGTIVADGISFRSIIPETHIAKSWSDNRSLKGAHMAGKSW